MDGKNHKVSRGNIIPIHFLFIQSANADLVQLYAAQGTHFTSCFSTSITNGLRQIDLLAPQVLIFSLNTPIVTITTIEQVTDINGHCVFADV